MTLSEKVLLYIAEPTIVRNDIYPIIYIFVKQLEGIKRFTKDTVQGFDYKFVKTYNSLYVFKLFLP